MTYKIAFSLALCPLIAASCAMVESTPLGRSDGPPLIANMTYSLPRMIVTAEVFKKDQKHTFENVKQSLSRDPDHTYALAYAPSPLSDDGLTLQADPDTGFLALLDGTATDKTLEIAKAAVEAIPAGFLNDSETDESTADTEERTRVLKLSFDPHTDLEVQNRMLREASVGLQLRCAACEPPAPPGPKIDGVYARPLKTVHLSVVDTNLGREVANFPLTSPNGSRLVALPMNRSLAVTRTTKYETFSEGNPTKVVQSKPSEALGLVTGVGEVVGAIIAAPVRGAADQVAATNASKSVSDAEASLIESETKRIEAETKRLEAEAALEALRLQQSTDGDQDG